MKTFFVTLSLFLVTFSAQISWADTCENIQDQKLCYDIEGTEDAISIEWNDTSQEDSMLVASDLAQNQMDNILVVSSELFQVSGDSMQDSIYDAFVKADELYYRFAYKVLDRNNRDTTVVITRD